MSLSKTNTYIIDHEHKEILVSSITGLTDFAFSTSPATVKKSLEHCGVKRVILTQPVILTPEFKQTVREIENCLGTEPIEVLVVRGCSQVKETVFVIGE